MIDNKQYSRLIATQDRAKHAHIREDKIIADLLQKHSIVGTMINVGAHTGSGLTVFVQQGWEIHAFEPDTKNRKALKDKFQNRIHVDERAVSDEDIQNTQFFKSNESTGISSLLSFHDSHEKSHIVDVISLKSYCKQASINRIDYLLIDSEGYDLPVLRGMDWKQYQPEVIVCEFEDRKTQLLDYDFHDLARYLCDRDYNVYVSEWHPVLKYGIKHDWRTLKKYPCELDDKNAWGNLIAIRSKISDHKIQNLFNAELKSKTGFASKLWKVIHRK